MNNSRAMYKEHILEHYRDPQNYGELEGATNSHTEHNTICGDKITVHLLVKDGKIEDIRFEGVGCAISMASTSLLTE